MVVDNFIQMSRRDPYGWISTKPHSHIGLPHELNEIISYAEFDCSRF